MSGNDVRKGQAIFFSQARPRHAQQHEGPPASTTEGQHLATTGQAPLEPPTQNTDEPTTQPSRIAHIVKFLVLAWFFQWFVRHFEIDRSLRHEPETPHISMTWLYLSMLALLPFVFVYFYASVWRRRVLGEPLDLQDWQASASVLVHVATIGLLFAWIFAVVALFPGYGFKSILITIVCTVCAVGLVDAIEGIF
ncbi:hypothetical protein GQ54DRAFT_205013 [Martensiomyces pterosporus]|nr:hypothetical protein GQ54DRAFT_205013 [Martensiomyces pterosporus]